jgi:hypothetical protein
VGKPQRQPIQLPSKRYIDIFCPHVNFTLTQCKGKREREGNLSRSQNSDSTSQREVSSQPSSSERKVSPQPSSSEREVSPQPSTSQREVSPRPSTSLGEVTPRPSTSRYYATVGGVSLPMGTSVSTQTGLTLSSSTPRKQDLRRQFLWSGQYKNLKTATV